MLKNEGTGYGRVSDQVTEGASGSPMLNYTPF